MEGAEYRAAIKFVSSEEESGHIIHERLCAVCEVDAHSYVTL